MSVTISQKLFDDIKSVLELKKLWHEARAGFCFNKNAYKEEMNDVEAIDDLISRLDKAVKSK